MDNSSSVFPHRNPFFLTFNRSEKIAVGVISVLYLVGIVGFIAKIHPDFLRLTPFNLLISLFIIFIFQPTWDWRIISFVIICPIVGFVVEMKGVETGLIFGNYRYGDTLGFKLRDTPLSIGVNWLLISYCSAVTISYFIKEKTNLFIKALLASVLMIVLDMIIEPIAMKTDMWSWENDIVPLQNYIGWFVTALILQVLFFLLNKSVKNKVAIMLLLWQFLFFGILNYFI